MITRVKFKGKVLVIGCGYVSRCTIPLLLKHLDMPFNNITIIDFADNRNFIREALSQGVNYNIIKITRENMHSILAKHVKSGDIIIDLAWYIECCEILQWCYDHNVSYVNTSVEDWLPNEGVESKTPQERTLYFRHMAIRKMVKKWKDKGPSMVVEHGANPGMVSHFTKLALCDIALKIMLEKPEDPRSKLFPDLLSAGNFPAIAQLTGTKVIHISERDTQIINRPKEPNEFVNTWSVEGFYEEGIAPTEMGWGTHEKTLPLNAYTHIEGPQNQICLAQCGIKTKVHSWVPSGEITGMVVRHGEAFTISDYLTVREKNKIIYRPTVHYAYCCCDAAINSIHELEMRNFSLQDRLRVMTDEIVSGSDELGVLLMGHDFKSWWCGSLLGIDEARKLAPGQNATTLQVASSVMAAVLWIIENPRKGFCVPDNLPYEEIIESAMPYLGELVSRPVDWTPMKNRRELFTNFNGDKKPQKTVKEEELWQFESFLVK